MKVAMEQWAEQEKVHQSRHEALVEVIQRTAEAQVRQMGELVKALSARER